MEERLDLIYRLKRKYGNTISEILAYQSQIAQALDELNFSATRIAELKGRIDTAMEDARQLAVELSQRRQKSAQKLETLIERELHTLGMDKTAFKVLVVPKEAPQDMKKQFAFPTIEHEGKRYELGPDGIDDIEFLISPNVGEELKPLTKIASGYYDNAKQGLPPGIGIIVLLDLKTSLPLAIIDGTYITAVRTGAAGAVAASVLARDESKCVGMIGSGTQGRMQVLGLNELYPLHLSIQ